jgi:hypothetical protein
MSRRTAILTLIVLTGLVGACAQQKVAIDTVEAAYSAVNAAVAEAETSEETATLVEGFLARFPDTEHSGWAATMVVHYRADTMKDPAGAYQALSAAFERIESPEQRFQVGMQMLTLADSVEVPLDVGDLASALGEVRPLTFAEHELVAVNATGSEQWALAQKHASAAFELATPEAFSAEFAEYGFTGDEMEMWLQHFRALYLAYEGWAAYNQGATELAFARFTESDAIGPKSYLGVPTTPLYTFWGRAALAEGDVERAIELLGAQTLFGEDGSGARPFLREAFVAENENDEGFDEFVWSTRNKLAASVDDFELADYDGNPVSLSKVGDGKVTLLAFWFPT